MNYDFEKECKFCFDYIADDNFHKQVWLRHFWGDQTYIRTTGSTNSGKTMINNWLYWLYVHGIYNFQIDKKGEMIGIYNYKPNLSDFFFGVKDLAGNISKIKHRCVRNNEAGTRGKHWNADDNTWWSQILQQQRSQRNIYIEDLPHTKEVSGITNIHCNFLLTIERFVLNYLKKEQKLTEIDIRNIASYEMHRRAIIYKYTVDYLGISPESRNMNYVMPVFFDKAWIPDFEKDKRWQNFLKWHNEVYMPYEVECKHKLGLNIENSVREKEIKDQTKNRRIRSISETIPLTNF